MGSDEITILEGLHRSKLLRWLTGMFFTAVVGAASLGWTASKVWGDAGSTVKNNTVGIAGNKQSIVGLDARVSTLEAQSRTAIEVSRQNQQLIIRMLCNQSGGSFQACEKEALDWLRSQTTDGGG